MSQSSRTSGFLKNSLEEMVLYREGMLSYFYLPKRQFGMSFTEITTANRNTSYPLAPDFTFHIDYSDKEVVLYEDYGPGCVYRIYLFPIMPTDTTKLYSMTPADLKDSYLVMIIDGRTFWFSLQQMNEGRQWPFLTPLNTQHPRPASGMGAYTPFCYKQSMKIAYQPPEKLPFNLFEDIVNCTNNDFLCDIHIYSAVSRHSFPVGTDVISFADISSAAQLLHKKTVESAAGLLSRPEIYGPESGERCILQCIEVCQTCRRMVFHSDQPGVITAMKVRVYETATSTLLEDWNQILITMRWDNSLTPQIDRVPLGALFGVAGSLNDFKGAAMGHRRRTCMFSDNQVDLRPTDCTGYIYFPMPYWRNADIYVEGGETLDTSILLCFQISTVENLYDAETTGYFNVAKKYYTDQVTGWSDMLTLDTSWGHVVGVLLDIDNLKARHNGGLSARWAALQADLVLFIDGSKSASMQGTGLEDYFSYAHGFALAENTSYAFVGNHHSAPQRKEPLTWHCYRLHVLDPIPFHHSVKFIIEGIQPDYYQPEQQLTYEEHWSRKSSGQAVLSPTILYYARSTSGATTMDVFNVADTASEQNHDFTIIHKSDKSSGQKFELENKRFLGNTYHDITYTKVGRAFQRGDKYSFNLKIVSPNNGIILRREFYSPPKEWNEKANVWINGQSCGIWYIPMGTLSNVFVLRDEDLHIHSNMTQEVSNLQVVIEPVTAWRDIAYHAIVIH